MLRVLITTLLFLLCLTTAYADRLSDIKSKGVLKAGVKYDFKPFGFKENGEVVGFDVDLLKYIAKELKVNLKLYQVTSKTRIPLIKADVIDIVAASMTHTQSRDVPIDFSIDYFYDGQSILVRSDAQEKSFEDFANKKVGVVSGSSSADNFFQKNPKAKIVFFDGYNQAINALNNKKIDAITTDYVWCSTKAKDSYGKLKVIGGTFTYEPYGMGIMENESNFRDGINIAIQQAVKDGTYEKLYLKWFGEQPKKLPPIWPK